MKTHKPRRGLPALDWLCDLSGRTARITSLGNRSLLVENHRGVQAYCPEEILIGLKFGQVRICGHNMVLTRMSREQLLIRGKIDTVSLLRRDST